MIWLRSHTSSDICLNNLYRRLVCMCLTVRKVEDLDDPTDVFHPDMCHQIFGDGLVVLFNFIFRPSIRPSSPLPIHVNTYVNIFVFDTGKPFLVMKTWRFRCILLLEACVHTLELNITRRYQRPCLLKALM